MRLFDEFNVLYENEILDIDTYFDDMELSEEEKEKRKKFSRELQNAVLFIFALLSVMKDHGYQNKKFIINQLQIRYSEILIEYMDIDKYLDDYIREFAEENVDVTLRHYGEKFFTSEERSLLIAVNEANSVFNYNEFSDAIKSGKTEKQWITEKDSRVRKTHRKVDNEIIPIKEAFVVGDSLMLFPKDRSLNASEKEIAGCRCTIKYF